MAEGADGAAVRRARKRGYEDASLAIAGEAFFVRAVRLDYWTRVQVWVLHSGATMQPRRRSVLSLVMVMVPR